MTSLERIAKKHNVKVIYKNNKIHTHIQLKGKLLVSYYPDSKKKTAYINGTKNSITNVTEERAVLMANEIPMQYGIKEPRKNSYTKVKKKKKSL